MSEAPKLKPIEIVAGLPANPHVTKPEATIGVNSRIPLYIARTLQREIEGAEVKLREDVTEVKAPVVSAGQMGKLHALDLAYEVRGIYSALGIQAGVDPNVVPLSGDPETNIFEQRAAQADRAA
jgi:hypothetical protein